MHINNHVLLNKELIAHILPMSSTEVKIFICILILANSHTGKLTIPLKGLAARVGLSYRMVNRAVLRLKEMGHIRYYSDCRSKESHIEIVNYVSRAEAGVSERQSCPSSEFDSQRHEEAQGGHPKEVGSEFGSNVQHDGAPSIPSAANIIKVQPETKVVISKPGDEMKKLLLNRIIDNFGDQQKRGFYESFCEKVGIAVIQRAYDEVRKVPPERIKHSKRALFVYLIQKYAGSKQ